MVEYTIGFEKNLIWVVTSTYYKHGDYETEIFVDKESLVSYLQEEIDRYVDYDETGLEYDEIDHDYKGYQRHISGLSFNNVKIRDLITKACFYGNNHVKEQRGFGIREITTIIEH